METTIKSEIIRFFVVETRDFDELLNLNGKKNKFVNRNKRKGRNQFKKVESASINKTKINSFKDFVFVCLIEIIEFADKIS